MKRTNLWLMIATLPWLSLNSLFAENVVTRYQKYLKAVQNTEQMVYSPDAQKLAKKVGLSLLNVTWEDTGRTKNSVWGDNISDVTIQVQTADPKNSEKIKPVLMPVLRYDNFNDKTADLPPSKFNLLVGNEKGEGLKKISLTEYLGNFRKYLSNERSWKGEKQSLLAPRDSHVLVSAQHALLPVPQGDKAIFNPVIFNYQSYEDQPAVLTILATREGTSATIIDYSRDSFEGGHYYGHGQRLFFNENGQKASFTGERISDFREGASVSNEVSIAANDKEGLNMVLMIQVPLKNVRKQRYLPMMYMAMETLHRGGAPDSTPDVEEAVIGHGETEGPFMEIDELAIQRDDRYPIRVTVQFYQATSNGVLSLDVVKKMRQQIDQVYKNADYVGSLVTEGETGRPTEHQGPQCHLRPWWPIFLEKAEASASQVEELLFHHYGPYYHYYCGSLETIELTWNFLTKGETVSEDQPEVIEQPLFEEELMLFPELMTF